MALYSDVKERGNNGKVPIFFEGHDNTISVVILKFLSY